MKTAAACSVLLSLCFLFSGTAAGEKPEKTGPALIRYFPEDVVLAAAGKLHDTGKSMGELGKAIEAFGGDEAAARFTAWLAGLNADLGVDLPSAVAHIEGSAGFFIDVDDIDALVLALNDDPGAGLQLVLGQMCVLFGVKDGAGFDTVLSGIAGHTGLEMGTVKEDDLLFHRLRIRDEMRDLAVYYTHHEGVVLVGFSADRLARMDQERVAYECYSEAFKKSTLTAVSQTNQSMSTSAAAARNSTRKSSAPTSSGLLSTAAISSPLNATSTRCPANKVPRTPSRLLLMASSIGRPRNPASRSRW